MISIQDLKVPQTLLRLPDLQHSYMHAQEDKGCWAMQLPKVLRPATK